MDWFELARADAEEFCPDPGVIATDIVEDLQAALDQFAEIANDLKRPR